MISCCFLSGRFSPQILCVLLLSFGDITVLLKMLFGKKKGCMFILRTVTESNFSLVCLSIRWQ